MAPLFPSMVRPYDPSADSDGMHHDDSPCALAVEDRGMEAIVQSANRENAFETANAVLDITHPAIVLGTCIIDTRSN
jgi:hypothetical protein